MPTYGYCTTAEVKVYPGITDADADVIDVALEATAAGGSVCARLDGSMVS